MGEIHVKRNMLKGNGYLLYLVEERGASASMLNGAINAFKFYYGAILKKEFLYEMVCPRKGKKLPMVLSWDEVAKVFSVISSIKLF